MKKSFYVGFIMDFDFKKQIIQESLLQLKQNGLIFKSTIYQVVLRLEKRSLILFLLRKRSLQGNAINIYIVC